MRVPLTLRDYVAMLGAKRFKRAEYLPRIYQALKAIDDITVTWQRREWRVVQVLALPRADTRLGVFSK